MLNITKITHTDDKPIIDTCIILGEVNQVNYRYINEDQCYYIIFSPDKLTDEQFSSVIYSDKYLDKYF